MQRSEFHIFLLFLIASWHLVACSSGSTVADGIEYNVEVSFDADSIIATQNLYLFIDNHRNISKDTLRINKSLVARYSGITAGTDELFLLWENGNEICHFYATAGANVVINISSKEDALVIDYTSPSDTLNTWLQQLHIAENIVMAKEELTKQTQHTLDSLKECGETGLRTTLLLREYMPYLGDSIYVRRFMGGITESGKPDWLMKSIDMLYPKLRSSTDYGRLTAAQFQMNDTIITINTSSRSDYMLLYFWGDYSDASVDSLKALSRRINRDYADKRLLFLTFCVSAPDSTWWNSKIRYLPIGHHALISGGLADPRISEWAINQAPYNIITDMFTNIQNRDIWDEDLQKALNRIPKRTNFSQPKLISK